MNDDFTAAMQRATALTRDGNLADATKAIQDALSGSGGQKAATSAAPSTSASQSPPTARSFSIDPAAPDATVIAEPVADPRLAPTGTPSAQRRHMPLGKVVDTLRAGKSAFGLAKGHLLRSSPRQAKAPALPDGAQFLSHSFTCTAGRRDYRLFIPAPAPDGPNGVIVMLHGCTQTPEDFATGTNMNAVAQEHNLLVVYPGQANSHNASACWNWFNPADQRRGAGEPAILAGIAQEVAAQHGITARRTFVAGLSAGGAMAAVMGEAYPEVFAAIGVHSGIPTGTANDVLSAFAAMRGDGGAGATGRTQGATARPRMIIFHGSADKTVHPRNADHIFAQAVGGIAAGAATEQGTQGGRSYARKTVTAQDGTQTAALWLIDGAGHAWSGGNPGGSYADARGPDASAQMVRFFLS